MEKGGKRKELGRRGTKVERDVKGAMTARAQEKSPGRSLLPVVCKRPSAHLRVPSPPEGHVRTGRSEICRFALPP